MPSELLDLHMQNGKNDMLKLKYKIINNNPSCLHKKLKRERENKREKEEENGVSRKKLFIDHGADIRFFWHIKRRSISRVTCKSALCEFVWIRLDSFGSDSPVTAVICFHCSSTY